jgi:ribonuclease R
MSNSSSPTVREFKVKDPFAEREAGKYERPIPSRELIIQVLKDQGVPLKLEEVARVLGVEDEGDIESLRRRLNAMERDGQLLRNRRDYYCIVNHRDLISGRVIGHPDGFGFLRPDEGGEDLFISPKEMRALMHDDRVVVCVRGVDRRGRREAGLVEVLERGVKRLVGRLYRERGITFVVPDNKYISHDILIPEESVGEALPGQIVVVEIIEQPTRQRDPIGRVQEVLGDHMAPGMEIEVALRSFDLPSAWPDAVLREIEGLGEEIPESAKADRVDLRHLPLVTIDGEDARDFDDAVYCERTPKGWRLFVAIADVSHYVHPGSALDEEAKNRGNSVYFPDRVIPMLPEILSNGLCSLNPEVDRLCMACEMSISTEGKIVRSQFFSAVMRSHARLTYTEVAQLLAGGNRALRTRRRALLPHLEELHSLFKVLRRAREERGTMDFDTQESRIIFGEGKKIEKIVPVERNDAHRLIEECMIAANIAAARFLVRQKLPHLVRVHEGPTAEKLADLRTFLGKVGLSLGGGDKPESKDYFVVLDHITGRPDEHLIQTLLLRSLAQAVYSPETTKGHFGLALEAYTHFTSPIRRYPDLLIHRAIRHCLEKKKKEEFFYSLNDMALLGEHCSFTERRADDATRDVVAWLKCEYMLDKLGEEFSGIISAVTPFGFFVELKDVFVEGLVHVSTLDKDYFHYDPTTLSLEGNRTGIKYRLGDAVRVIVARVDLDERKIDLELVKAKPAKEKTGGRSRRKRRKS